MKGGFHERIKGKVMTTDVWVTKHAPHKRDGEDFTLEGFPHPSGQWFWLCCPCKAKQLIIVEKETPIEDSVEC